MELNDFLNNPAFKDIDKNKLEMLYKLTSEAGSRKDEDVLPFLMSAFAGNNGIDFNDKETETILEALKPGMSPKELKKIETIKKISKMIAQRSKGL